MEASKAALVQPSAEGHRARARLLGLIVPALPGKNSPATCVLLFLNYLSVAHSPFWNLMPLPPLLSFVQRCLYIQCGLTVLKFFMLM